MPSLKKQPVKHWICGTNLFHKFHELQHINSNVCVLIPPPPNQSNKLHGRYLAPNINLIRMHGMFSDYMWVFSRPVHNSFVKFTYSDKQNHIRKTCDGMTVRLQSLTMMNSFLFIWFLKFWNDRNCCIVIILPSLVPVCSI